MLKIKNPDTLISKIICEFKKNGPGIKKNEWKKIQLEWNDKKNYGTF